MATIITLTLLDDVVVQAQIEAHQAGKLLQELLADALRQVYPAATLHPRHAQMQEEGLAFQTLHSQLVKTYLGKFVAIKDGQLVDHDLDFDTLIDRVREQDGKSIGMVDQVLPALLAVSPLRSPQWV